MRNDKNEINPDFPCCSLSIDMLIEKALRELTSKQLVLSAGNIVELVECQYGRTAADKVLARLTEEPLPVVEYVDNVEDDDISPEAIIAATGRQCLIKLGTAMLSSLKIDKLVTDSDYECFESAVFHRYGIEIGSGVIMALYSCVGKEPEVTC